MHGRVRQRGQSARRPLERTVEDGVRDSPVAHCHSQFGRVCCLISRVAQASSRRLHSAVAASSAKPLRIVARLRYPKVNLGGGTVITARPDARYWSSGSPDDRPRRH
ncbi:hypothetical protein MES5069_30002 [Mesorhizobium escarrei]|uniref:Uncharacterized protein n=1 Tax=Mesorhizobium escarrei TaxID=666018 RepID=A0ABN8JVF8_9HYPH|nr:hypothetical protein MES5069_30002 [Mesorhizobium escarrei]